MKKFYSNDFFKDGLLKNLRNKEEKLKKNFKRNITLKINKNSFNPFIDFISPKYMKNRIKKNCPELGDPSVQPISK